jgi:hypothetical protein
METPNYIKALLKPNAGKPQGRKVWSIDLETVWIPFFTATNAMSQSNIPSDALGAPLRLAYNQDGSVKFSKSGRPVIKVSKDISDNVKLVRENFIAGLTEYTHTVYSENGEAYKAQVSKAMQAGKPILDNDKAKLNEAMAKMVEQAIEEAETHEHRETETPERERELVTA